MISLPPGMKRRNPGTKKIALETPVKTQKQTVTNTNECNHTFKAQFNISENLLICVCAGS